MRRRIERSPLPDPATLRKLVAERASDLHQGAVVVDADAQGSTGIDLLLVDEAGTPIFVDVMTEGTDGVPARVFDHLGWMEKNRRLFLRAYARDGVVNAEEPEFVFVAGRFPEGVVQAVGAIEAASVRLVRAEYLLIDGEGELLLEDVAPGPAKMPASTPVAKVADGGHAMLPRLEEGIESPPVRALLGLFKSGVDGLDARIVETASNGGVTFEMEGRVLARVSVSPASFTVSPGAGGSSPIVVSDRVSLERALHAVVSQFVRDEKEPRVAASPPELSDEERTELAGIWGSGISGSEDA